MIIEAAIGLTIFLIAATIIKRKQKRKINLKRLGFSQSSLHKVVKDLLPTNAELRKKTNSQAKMHKKNNTVKVIYTPDQKAYWVKQNTFFCADLVDGQFDPSDGKPINTDGLSKKEIEKLLFILDNLNG